MSGPWDNYAPPAQAAPDQTGIPAAPEGAPVGSVPVEVEINKGVSPAAQEVDQDIAQANATDASANGAPWNNYAPQTDASAPTQPPANAKPDFGLGLYAGAMRPWDNAAIWTEGLLNKLGVPMTGLDHLLGAPTAQEAADGHAKFLSDEAAQGNAPGGWGRIAGSTLASVPTMALGGGPLGAILGGAADGALNTDDPHSLLRTAESAGIGGALGGAAHAVLGAVGSAVSPHLSDAVQTLLANKVPLTIGQIAGGAVHRLEDGLTSFPGLGDMIGNAQGRAVKGYNAAVINRSLQPVGEALPNNLQAGREAVDYAHQTLSNRYDSLLPGMSVQRDQAFDQAVPQILSDAKTLLTPERGAQLENIISSRLDSRLPVTGMMPGETMKQVDSELGALARTYGKSGDPDQRTVGGAIGDVQDQLRALVARNNPAQAPELDALNTGWANLKRAETAAAGSGAHEGIFTPLQHGRAVRQLDSSAGKSAYARGQALQQDLSDAGSAVLPKTVPDSGSPFRHALEASVALMVGKESGSPFGKAAVLSTLPGLAYTKAGQTILQHAMATRPAGATALRDLLTKAKGPAGVLAASAAPALLPQR